MSNSHVHVEGPAPLELHSAQRGMIRAVTGSVEATLYVTIEGKSDPRAIILQMPPRVARELAMELVEAANQIQRWKP
jgi:hypothetical protein